MPATRETLRFSIDVPGRLRIGDTEITCRITNLSRGGAFIAGPAITIGTRVTLKFRAPYVDAFECRCISRWNTAEGTGLMFEALRPDDSSALARFFRHATRSTAQLPTDAVLRPPAR